MCVLIPYMIKPCFLSFIENRISVAFNTMYSKLRKLYDIFINSIVVQIAARCSAKNKRKLIELDYGLSSGLSGRR